MKNHVGTDFSGPVLVSQSDLDDAVTAGLVTPEQARALWATWACRPATATGGPRFNFTNVLYYFGGLIAIGSMSLFMTLGWSALGPGGLLAITLANIAACLFGARWLERQSLTTPAGILATLAVVMVPLAAWCGQHLAGMWPPGSSFHKFSDYHDYVDWRWLTLEAATLTGAAAMLWRHRFPFMIMPVAVTLWYMSMDGAAFLSRDSGFSFAGWALYREVSLVFGLLTTLCAIWVDLRARLAGSRKDFAFWLYLFGVMMAWTATSLSNAGSGLGKLAYCAVNIGMVFFGAAIGRRVFTFFGAFGVAGYLGYLSRDVFGDSLMFPFALCMLGLAVVAGGVWWQRHEPRLQRRLSAWLPAMLRPLGRSGG